MTHAVDLGMDRLVRSKHAEERCRARSISDRVMELVVTYGRQVRRRGANVFLLDRVGFEDMLSNEDTKEISRLLPKLRAYFVVSDNWTLVTAGYVLDAKTNFATQAEASARARLKTAA
jgi:hypothetical protein